MTSKKQKTEKNQLSFDAWTKVFEYLWNPKDQWKFVSLTYTTQLLVCEKSNRFMVMIEDVHSKLFFLKERAMRISHPFQSKKYQQQLFVLKKAGHSDEYTAFNNFISKNIEAVCSHYIYDRLTEDISPLAYRHEIIHLDVYRWKKVAWFLFFKPLVHLTGWISPSISNASLHNGLDGYVAIHSLLVWYIRITNDLKEINITSSLVIHQHFPYVYRSIGDTIHFLLSDWASRCVNHRNYHVPFMDTLETYSFEFVIHYQDDKIICFQDDNVCDFVVYRKTNLIYNHILEPVGIFDPSAQKLHFYLNTHSEKYFVKSLPMLHECQLLTELLIKEILINSFTRQFSVYSHRPDLTVGDYWNKVKSHV